MYARIQGWAGGSSVFFFAFVFFICFFLPAGVNENENGGRDIIMHKTLTKQKKKTRAKKNKKKTRQADCGAVGDVSINGVCELCVCVKEAIRVEGGGGATKRNRCAEWDVRGFILSPWRPETPVYDGNL